MELSFSIKKEKKGREKGIILVTVMIALLASAGIVAAIYVVGKSAGQVAGGWDQGIRVRSFADGALAFCPRLVSQVIRREALTAIYFGFTNGMIDPGGNNGVPDLRTELTMDPSNAPWWSGDIAGGPGNWQYYWDLVLESDRYRLTLDIDLLSSEVAAGEGMEFGAGAEERAQGSKIRQSYRCYAEARMICGPGGSSVDCPRAGVTSQFLVSIQGDQIGGLP
jgi:hypothetical protein